MRKRFMVMLATIALFAGAACTPQEIIWHIFPGEYSKAESIVHCESRFNPNAVSRTGDHGLFQINEKTWNKPGHPDPVADYIGQNWHNRYDPLTNALMAKKIRDKYGWKMWACN